jgi:hypothetical protein
MTTSVDHAPFSDGKPEVVSVPVALFQGLAGRLAVVFAPAAGNLFGAGVNGHSNVGVPGAVEQGVSICVALHNFFSSLSVH